MRPTWTIAGNAYPDDKMQWYRLGCKFGCKSLSRSACYPGRASWTRPFPSVRSSRGISTHVRWWCLQKQLWKWMQGNAVKYVLFVQVWAFSSASHYRLSHRHFWSPSWLSFLHSTFFASLLYFYFRPWHFGTRFSSSSMASLPFPLAPPC